MSNPLEYIRQRPKLAKQLIGLNLPELENLIQQAISFAASQAGRSGGAEEKRSRKKKNSSK